MRTFKGVHSGRRHVNGIRRHIGSVIITFLLIAFLLLLDSLIFKIIDYAIHQSISTTHDSTEIENTGAGRLDNVTSSVQMYERLLNLASISLAEKEITHESSKYWEESSPHLSRWKPCSGTKMSKGFRREKVKNNTGFIVVSANGGLNQQRVAVCNAVAVASLLNASLVIPKFLYSNVWNDPSQFGDLYQEDHFMNSLIDDVDIVKELPHKFQSLDMEAIGSLVTDADLSKEAKPEEYIRNILPILLRNRVVHFLGFANRLGFDPLSSELQRLRCKCNFHALKFVPKIQEVASLLIRRIRKNSTSRSALNEQLLGNFQPTLPSKENNKVHSKYLALHLRFEVDMVAYSMCEFGGGEHERRELQAYREAHFPLLIERVKKSKATSPSELREMGKCPLTPEEAALFLAGLGFSRDTYIYLAGSHIYRGKSHMHPLTSLYPNIVSKEDLLSQSELAPFMNFSSQLAALDFIACATADVFAITDSGSQLSSLVSGLRTYYGGGAAPTLTPNKKRLASILSRNKTIKWGNFEEKIRKMTEESQRVRIRAFGRSIYRQPRCKDCMCKLQ
ncbi:hypothetical protein Leryth_022288 [Lithospermum erythrorhizon]|nr:hypothetical protein Leryth_022288 [Lithospermum erythrorhizon]